MTFKKSINFSLWCDFIERDFLEDEFQNLLKNQIIHGATSNPAIFEQSLSTSTAYIQQIEMLQANELKKIYEELAITDIKRAAQIMYPLYEKDENDGFISIEVDPSLCDDAQATIEEGIRLFDEIHCDNVMIKIPATKAGYVAMKELTSKGINVNATLVFSTTQAIQCTEALNEGIKLSNQNTKAVVSIFVSRFDRLLDSKLKSLNLQESKTGILNATKCYHEIQKFKNQNIRTLFASTGVKGDTLDKSYYIDALIYPHSINTAPLATINEYVNKNNFIKSNIIDENECDEYFSLLKENGIDIEKVSKELLNDGLESFKVSFSNMIKKLKIEK